MLHTIGYEGARLSDFIATLEEAKIEFLIDVRERAQSRKKGFSKTVLSESLRNVGIEYLHLRELGDPKEGRDAARSGNFEKFEKIYKRVLETSDAQNAVNFIIEKSQLKRVCLLCYERNPVECHRKRISDLVDKKTGTKTGHLGVRILERAA